MLVCLSVRLYVSLPVCLSVSLYVVLYVCLSALISAISHQQANMQCAGSKVQQNYLKKIIIRETVPSQTSAIREKTFDPIKG